MIQQFTGFAVPTRPAAAMEQQNIFIVSPEFGGYLMKRGFYWRKLWKKRWVILHGAEIAYMDKKPENISNIKDMNISTAQITSQTQIDSEDLDDDPNGFALMINDYHPGTTEPKTPTWYLRAETLQEKHEWLDRLSRVHAIICWLDDYEKIRVLGTGGSGIVYELKHKVDQKSYAMKEMDLQNSFQVSRAVAEVEILMNITQSISHPNIMRIERVFQVGDKFYMVFPLCTGGELYEAIIKRKHFTEYDAACIMRDLIGALATLHDHNILHLDIKPENILYTSDGPDAKILLTDFGLSRVLDPDDQDEDFNQIISPTASPRPKSEVNPTLEEMEKKLKAFLNVGILNRSMKGTIGYMSPELILAGVNTKAVDIWASGVVLYILLCGTPPFHSRSNRETLEKSAKGEYSLSGPEWDSISADAKDLISKMLCYDPSKRITAREILKHPWIVMVSDEEETEITVPSVISDELPCEPTTPPCSSPLDVSLHVNAHSFSSLPTQKTMTRRQSASNTVLNSALRKLTTHVHERKLEKMTSNITRLMSTMQVPGRKASYAQSRTKKFPIVNALRSRLRQRMGQQSMNNSPEIDDEISASVAESLTNTISNEVRDHIVRYFFNQQLDGRSSDEIGKLSVEQFALLLSEILEVTGAPIVMITRFIDNDGDGFITVGDIILAETKMAQRSPDFLKMFFSLYIDAIWYPGRNINQMNMGFTSNTLAKGTTVLKNMITGDAPLQNFTTPKYITGINKSFYSSVLIYS